MGNRATIEVKDSRGYSAPAFIYLHWNGSPDDVIMMVEKAEGAMRKTDACYAFARLIGTYHNEIAGGLSLGVVAPSDSNLAMNESLLDNGHYVIDMGRGTITQDGEEIASGFSFGEF